MTVSEAQGVLEEEKSQVSDEGTMAELRSLLLGPAEAQLAEVHERLLDPQLTGRRSQSRTSRRDCSTIPTGRRSKHGSGSNRFRRPGILCSPEPPTLSRRDFPNHGARRYAKLSRRP